MILLWLLFCFVHNLMAQTPVAPPKPGIDIKSKPVMCDYRTSGPYGMMDKTLPEMPPESMPQECDIVVFEDFVIDNKSSIICDTNVLKKLTSVKPVMIGLYRKNHYNEWAYVLKDEKIYTKEAEALVEFAKKNNVIGYRLHKLSPEEFMDTADKNVAIKIVDYVKKLKDNTNLIVGYSVNEYISVIDNPCVTAFAELNGVVDFYTMRTSQMNSCRNELFNGLNPINFTKHGVTYMMSMEEVWKYVEASKCDLEKVYLMADILPAYIKDYVDKNNKAFVNYNQICEGIDIQYLCVPDTNQLYAKGSYIKQVRCGLTITFVNLDNFDDTCGCGKFVGTRNICAGYFGKAKMPCPKFDVQKAPKGPA